MAGVNLLQTRIQIGAASLAVVAVIAAAAWGQMPQPPVQPPPPAQPGAPGLVSDPRVAQVKAAVERLGQRVLAANLVRQTNGNLAWIVTTPAAYGQPSFDGVFKQAQTVWWGTWGFASSDPPDTTLLVNGQIWNRYTINQIVTLRDYATFISSYQGARTDADRARAFQTLWENGSYSVFDHDRGQYIDSKDFSSKNFTR